MTVINVFSRLTLIPLIIGLLFKAMHWPGATFMLIIASVFLLLFHLIKFFTTKEKQNSDYLLIGTIGLFSLGSLFIIFSGINIPSFHFFCLIILFTYLITKFQYEGASMKQHIIASIFFWPALVLVVFGGLFKLMHWPGASIMLILSSAIGMIWVLTSLLNFSLSNNVSNDEIDEIGKS